MEKKIGYSTAAYFVSLAFLFATRVLGQTTLTYSYTGSMQSFVVPSCVTALTLDVQGSQGGTNSNSNTVGGRGGSAAGVLAVNPGDVLNIFLGRINGYNGGGPPGGSISTAVSTLAIG